MCLLEYLHNCRVDFDGHRDEKTDDEKRKDSQVLCRNMEYRR